MQCVCMQHVYLYVYILCVHVCFCVHMCTHVYIQCVCFSVCMGRVCVLNLSSVCGVCARESVCTQCMCTYICVFMHCFLHSKPINLPPQMAMIRFVNI